MTAYVSGVGELGDRLVQLLEEEGVMTLRAEPGSLRDLRRAVHEADVVYLVDDADGTSGESFREMWETNLDGPRRLLEEVEPGQRVVLLSSVQVYAAVPPSQWPITEDHPRQAHGGWPTRAYGVQKIEVENHLMRGADERRYDYVLLRSTPRFGRRGELSQRITHDFRNRPRAAIAAYQGLSETQWVSVDDLASALVASGTSRVARGEAFNIAGREPEADRDLADLVHVRPFGDVLSGFAEGRGRAPAKFDTSKVQAMLGWAPETHPADWLSAGDRMGAVDRGWAAPAAPGWTFARPWSGNRSGASPARRGCEMFDLSGKVVVVTGGGRGIGLMMAEGLLRAGAKVYLSSRKAGDLEAAAESLSTVGPVEPIPADLGTAAGVETLAARLAEREDAISVLFNNAGVTWGAPFDEFPESGFDEVFAVNVKGVFLLTRALLPLLKAASTPDDPARVINTGSIDGIRPPGPGRINFSYSASKAAVHMLTRHLAGVLAPEVLVNAIAPGMFPTKMTKEWLAAGAEAVGACMPLGRIGRADDIAGVSVFLASRASSYITGAVIPVDGGVSTIR